MDFTVLSQLIGSLGFPIAVSTTSQTHNNDRVIKNRLLSMSPFIAKPPVSEI